MQTRIKSNHSFQVFNFSLLALLESLRIEGKDKLDTFEERVPTGRTVTNWEYFHGIMRLTVKNAFEDCNHFKSFQ